jgi:hypothetical protein
MSRIETLRRSTAQAHEQRLAPLAQQMRQLREMGETVDSQIQMLTATQMRNVEDLARRFLPLAQSIASLTEETRRTMTMIVERTASHAKRSAEDMRAATAAAQTAADRARQTSARLDDQLSHLSALIEDVRRQPSPWPPALATMAIIVAAVLWLAWRMRLL